MPTAGFTGIHVDWVYMGRGTNKLLTCWIPIGRTTVEMGTITILESSNSDPAFEEIRNTYGQMDAEKINLKGTGWLTKTPSELNKYGAKWVTNDFEAGDVVIFPMQTLHMSTTNITDKARISCDTRWQPISAPIDPRQQSHYIYYTY